ncbi:MAG: serine/threonine protein kinase [Kofleriaceae bacterium]|nr:serine/threonine protein kinase [Kofleriaceae bacterium]
MIRHAAPAAANLGPFRLRRRLGRGGMAEVHLADAVGASGFQRAVAIKTVAPELQGEASLERALIHEATLAGRFHHRNLVAILGLGVDDGRYYVVMEYVDGGDLAGHLGRPLPLALALMIAHEVALGLAYLHAATDDRGLPLGLVHRDVGPRNVLVSTSGDVKLADFGLTKPTALADLTAPGLRKGTWQYMAPEQIAGDPVTAAADQFGLGVTLVELVGGAHPFAADTPAATMAAIERSDPALGGLAPDLRAVAARALARRPTERFPSMAAFGAALGAARQVRPLAGPVELGAWVAAGPCHFVPAAGETTPPDSR